MAHYTPINTTVHQEAQTVLKILESAVTQQCHSDILWTTQNTALHIYKTKSTDKNTVKVLDKSSNSVTTLTIPTPTHQPVYHPCFD